jgi:hypothetical protein
MELHTPNAILVEKYRQKNGTKKIKKMYYVLKKNEQISTYCIDCEFNKNSLNSKRKSTKEKWIKNNKVKINVYGLEYHHNVRKNNMQYRLAQSLRSEMHRVLNKKNSTCELLGCDINYFEKWMEFQFNNKMNWDNYGEYWEIDHVTPCNSYKLEFVEEQFKCFNWTNLRPLEVYKNRSKKDKIYDEDIFKQKLNVIFKRRQDQIAGTS